VATSDANFGIKGALATIRPRSGFEFAVPLPNLLRHRKKLQIHRIGPENKSNQKQNVPPFRGGTSRYSMRAVIGVNAPARKSPVSRF
jgi:hypothetical protein